MKKIKIIALALVMFSQLAGAATINRNPTVTNFNTVYSYWKNTASNPNSPVYQVAKGADYNEINGLVNVEQRIAGLFILSKISNSLTEQDKALEGLSSVCYDESIVREINLTSCITGELIEGGGINVVNEYFQYKVSKKSWELLAKNCMITSGGAISYSYYPAWNSSALGYNKFSQSSGSLDGDLCAEILSEKSFSSAAVFPVTETRTNKVATDNALGYQLKKTLFPQFTATDKRSLYNRTYYVSKENCADVSWLISNSNPAKFKQLCLNWKKNGLDNYNTFAAVARLPWESVRYSGQDGGYKTYSSKRCPRKWDAYNGRNKSKIRSDWWHHTDTGKSVYDYSFDEIRRIFYYEKTYRGKDFVMYCQQGKFGYHHKQVRWDFDITYKWNVPLLLGKQNIKTGFGIDPSSNSFTLEYPIADYNKYTTKTLFKKFSNNLYSFNNKTMEWLTKEVNWNFANRYSCTNSKDSFDVYRSDSYKYTSGSLEILSKPGETPLKITVEPNIRYLKPSSVKSRLTINSCKNH
jgi:hypothetical protein